MGDAVCDAGSAIEHGRNDRELHRFDSAGQLLQGIELNPGKGFEEPGYFPCTEILAYCFSRVRAS